jgi:hypothetical protein
MSRGSTIRVVPIPVAFDRGFGAISGTAANSPRKRSIAGHTFTISSVSR